MQQNTIVLLGIHAELLDESFKHTSFQTKSTDHFFHNFTIVLSPAHLLNHLCKISVQDNLKKNVH